jgi:hypothetical protein
MTEELSSPSLPLSILGKSTEPSINYSIALAIFCQGDDYVVCADSSLATLFLALSLFVSPSS